MSTRPVIFISAVSKELHSARDLVAKTLLALGFEPKWEDIAATDQGDLLGVLRGWIDQSDAVLQIVGHSYGLPLKEPDPQFGPCSHTQYEAHYAHQQHKPVYYILTDDTYPADNSASEPRDLQDLQEKYRQEVKSCGELYHTTGSLTQTELLVRRLKDDLAELRAEGEKRERSLSKRLNLILGLMAVLIIGFVWIIINMNDPKNRMYAYPQKYSERRQLLVNEGDATRRAAVFADIDHQDHRSPGTSAKELPQYAQQLLQRADTSAIDRANAFFLLQDFAQAETEALKAADHAIAARQPVQNIIDALRLAGQSAETQNHFTKAMEHYLAAATYTSKESDVLQWLKLQNAISALYYFQGDHSKGLTHAEEVWLAAEQARKPEAPSVLAAHMLYATALFSSGNAAAAEAEYLQVIPVQERVLGIEAAATLASRNNLAIAMNAQGKHAEAEKVLWNIINIETRVLSADHPYTLTSRMNLALAMKGQGRHADAENEYRSVLEIQTRVLGPEHIGTLRTQMNLAVALEEQGKNEEAEKKYRAVLTLQQRVLPADHHDTLACKVNLANVLQKQSKYFEAEQLYREVLKVRKHEPGEKDASTLSVWLNLAGTLKAQGKHAEAEQEYRAVLQIQERMLKPEDPAVVLSCFNIASCLSAQHKIPEALQFMQRAELLLTKIYGSEHSLTKKAKADRELFEAALKQKQAK